MKRIAKLIFILAFLPQFLKSQDRPILYIDEKPVYLSEFERIYHKNNNIEGYESKTPAEYLEMFINFKLKVLEAKKLGYDTLPSFISELAGYREQLSRPYLQDRNLINELVNEAYYRTVNEVNASHIMVKLPAMATPADTLAAYNKALKLRDRVIAGESFEKIAREESDDPSAKANSGNLGWFSAFVMVYPFENAAYHTKMGACSMPVRSKYGYHIIRVNGMRKSLGEIKLAHILVRSNRNDAFDAAAKSHEKINECYQLLNNGASFVDMVKQFSEDPAGVKNGGQMRWLRSGELPSDIENAVFALKDSGSFTKPIQSEYGWHIFQLQGKRPVPSFEEIKPQLEEKLMMDERGKQTEEIFFNTLKKEFGFVQFPENLAEVINLMDSSIYTGSWNPANYQNLTKPVFSINGKAYLQKELIAYILKTKRYNRRDNYDAIAARKLEDYANKELMNTEKNMLEEKYPAFKYLMEEYHDGILLFNIMDDKVWSKATNDSAGLSAFYNAHKTNYNWTERADISIYTVKDAQLMKTVMKLAKKRINSHLPAADFIKKVCASDSVQCLEVSDLKLESGDPQPLGGFEWKKGFSKADKNKLLVVNAILPPSQKAFSETQGQVIADYQNLLDNQWIESLRNSYKVVVDHEALQQVK